MSEVKEIRTYYGDRTLKSVYFVNKHGQKQGQYIEYKQNSNEVLKNLIYENDSIVSGFIKTDKGSKERLATRFYLDLVLFQTIVR